MCVQRGPHYRESERADSDHVKDKRACLWNVPFRTERADVGTGVEGPIGFFMARTVEISFEAIGAEGPGGETAIGQRHAGPSRRPDGKVVDVYIDPYARSGQVGDGHGRGSLAPLKRPGGGSFGDTVPDGAPDTRGVGPAGIADDVSTGPAYVAGEADAL